MNAWIMYVRLLKKAAVRYILLYCYIPTQVKVHKITSLHVTFKCIINLNTHKPSLLVLATSMHSFCLAVYQIQKYKISCTTWMQLPSSSCHWVIWTEGIFRHGQTNSKWHWMPRGVCSPLTSLTPDRQNTPPPTRVSGLHSSSFSVA